MEEGCSELDSTSAFDVDPQPTRTTFSDAAAFVWGVLREDRASKLERGPLASTEPKGMVSFACGAIFGMTLQVRAYLPLLLRELQSHAAHSY